ncbi:MAG: hypothetical protein N2260_07630 [Syntrophobacterales bacterium]|nr:hypothetical protein [Syntrophobacterales bacterium]
MQSGDIERLDRILLNRLQQSFPLVSEPFRELAEEFRMESQDVIQRIKHLKARRILRQISAIFNTGALGYRSSLIAVAVPEEAIERAAKAVNAYPGVSHNYLRPAPFNMWFTIAVPPWENMETVVKNLVREAGDFPFLILPALKKYKLAMVLDMVEESEGDGLSDSRSDVTFTVSQEKSFPLTPAHIEIVRCIQEDLPVVDKPFKYWADKLNLEEENLLETLREWIRNGIIRRFAAILNHREAGFTANGMVVWMCPEDRIDDAGIKLAKFPEVSHCYYRPAYPQWPYNLYAMIHGKTIERCREIAQLLAKVIEIPEYEVLFSVREFKKVRLKLFWD